MRDNVNAIYEITPDGTIFEGNISKEEFERMFAKEIEDFTYGTGEVFIKATNGRVSEI